MTSLTSLMPGISAHEYTQALPGGARMPVRMTVVDLPGDRLWVHSAAPLDEALARALEQRGRVAYIVAPSKLHHLHVGPLAARFPEAEIWGAPGLGEKRADLRLTGEIDGTRELPWAEHIESLPIGGAPAMSEVVFLHRATRSLFVTDLVFNVTRPEGFMTGMVLTMTGTRGRLAQSRVWGFSVKDRAGYDASMARVLSLDADRIVVAHGEIVEGEAMSRLRGALRVKPA